MEKYLNDLIRQFKLATGTKQADINSKAFIDEFSDWIGKRQLIGEGYNDFLDYMGVGYRSESCAEIGKGSFDSIVKPFETTIITPDSSFVTEDPERIICGNMRVFNDMPVLITSTHEEKQYDMIPRDIIRTYMTQNPTSEKSILNWENLHNSGKNNIIVGIYGSMYDKDITDKIKQLKAFRAGLTSDDYAEDYASTRDGYFYVIASDGKTRRHVRSRIGIR